MPIPKPRKGEKKGAFISRCISIVSKEKPSKQAQAICYKEWRNHSDDENESEDLLTTKTNNKMTMDINFRYGSNIDFEGDADETGLPLMVKGVSCRSGYIANKHFIIPKTELDNLASSLARGEDGQGAYFLKDHGYQSIFMGKSVDKLVGRVVQASKVGEEVLYKARVEDVDMAHKIRTKLVTASSVGIHVGVMRCSICGREYGHEECNHRLGHEYADEGLHDIAKDYLDDMEGKPLAAIVGSQMEAKEQSVVLFPAIKGASVGLNFSEDMENFFEEIEEVKKKYFEDKNKDTNKDGNKILINPDEILQRLDKLDKITEGFNKNLTHNNSREFKMEDFDIEKYTQDLADAKTLATQSQDKVDKLEVEKTELETSLTEATDKIDTLTNDLNTANEKITTQDEIITKYRTDEEERLTQVKTDLAETLKTLRETLELPEKDYSEKSLESMSDELELLESLPKPSGTTGIVPDGDPNKGLGDAKEDVRELIFKKRRSGDLKGLRKLPKVE